MGIISSIYGQKPNCSTPMTTRVRPDGTKRSAFTTTASFFVTVISVLKVLSKGENRHPKSLHHLAPTPAPFIPVPTRWFGHDDKSMRVCVCVCVSDKRHGHMVGTQRFEACSIIYEGKQFNGLCHIDATYWSNRTRQHIVLNQNTRTERPELVGL